MNSPELQAKIASWRIRAAEGTLTLDDMKEIITASRAGRMSSATSVAASKRKLAIAAIPLAADMLSELEGM